MPIVPVVIHNAGERMWRNSLVAHPGPVYVSVLDPISTEGWETKDLDAHVEKVRAQFELRYLPATAERARCSRANASACASIDDRSRRVRAFCVLISMTAWPLNSLAANC